jgi:cytochrome b561
MNLGTITMNAAGSRYDRTAVALHWIVGLGILAQLAFGWLLGEFGRGTPERALAINLHKSTGIVLALLIVLRLAWRLGHRPPAYAPQVDGRLLRMARLGHVLLYVCMLGMPLSGYLASNFSKHGIRFFNQYALAPWGPDDKDLYALFNGTHDVLAVAFSLLVAAHILAALHHGLIARDGVLARMTFGPRRGT